MTGKDMAPNQNQKRVLDTLKSQGINAQIQRVGKVWVADYSVWGGSDNGYFVDSFKVCVNGAPVSNKYFWKTLKTN